MNQANEPAEQQSPSTSGEPPSPDDLVHMYGGFLFFVAVPVILVLLIVYFFFIR